MKTTPHPGLNGDYESIAKAIAYIRDNVCQQPSLEQIASRVGLSPWHFQRKFKAWAGVSPKRFLEFLTVQHAKELLDKSAAILDAALDLGLSGPGRLHEQFVAVEAVTPGQYKQFGSGLKIYHGIHHSPFGLMLLALTDKGICELAFGSEEILDQEVNSLGSAGLPHGFSMSRNVPPRPQTGYSTRVPDRKPDARMNLTCWLKGRISRLTSGARCSGSRRAV